MNAYPHHVIRASAGTGKTYALSSHYLDLLRRGARPQDILATTFTRKAAGEILDRVLLRLAKAAVDPQELDELNQALGPPRLSGAQVQQLLAALCRSLHQVSISTIDAFFHRLAQMFRHELGIPPSPLLVDEGDSRVEMIRLRAIEAVLADQNTQVLVDLLRRLHHDSARRSVTEAINRIVQELYQTYLQAPDPQIWAQLQPNGQPLTDAQFAQALDSFRQLGQQLPQTRGGQVNRNWSKAYADALRVLEKKDWDAFLGGTLIQKICSGENTYYKIEIPPDWISASRPLIDHAGWHLVQRTHLQTIATHDLLQRFDQHFTRLRQAHRMMLFSDLPRILASDLPRLGNDLLTQVYFRLDARVAHLLLDEFQDTSVQQWEILQPLAAEAAATVDGSRSFFCVGDLKQSIYGWRGGCAEIFNHIQDQLHLDQQADRALSRSYRSSPILLKAVNTLFTNLADREAIAQEIKPSAQRWQEAFHVHTAAPKNNNLPGLVQLLTTVVPASEAQDVRKEPKLSGGAWEEIRPDEAEDRDNPFSSDPHLDQVASRVKQIAGECPGRSIGVLVFTNASVRSLIFRLRRLGVDASGEGGNPLTDEPAVLAILAALTLADHPGDLIARFHLLSSPLAARLNLRDNQPGDIPRWARQVRRQLLAQGYADLLSAWTRLIAPDCDLRGLTRLMQLVELADLYEQDATLRPKNFVQFVRCTDVEEPSPAPVRVMTVHKAKGLEFDAVVLPELNRDLGNVHLQPALVHRPSPVMPIDAVYRYANQIIRNFSPPLQQAFAQEQDRRAQDDLCALYVAVTRARYALYMMLKPLAPGRNNKAISRLLREVFTPKDFGEDPDGGEVLFSDGQSDWHKRIEKTADSAPRKAPTVNTEQSAAALQALRRSSADSRRSWRLTSPSAHHEQGRVKITDLLSLQPSNARLRGTIMHAFFQAIQWLGHPEYPPPNRADLLAIARTLAPQADANWLEQLISQFQEMLARPGIRAALAHPQDSPVTLWREQPFVLRMDQQLVRGVFDRVVLLGSAQQPDRVHLLDFKTDRVEADESNIPQLVDSYSPQMQMYRAALAQMLRLQPGQIRASLLLVGADKLIDIPVPEAGSS